MTEYFQCGRYQYPIRPDRPIVMGILNITPDSFSDAGQHFSLAAALDHAEKMIAEGVDIIDIGAESTRPGAAPVPLQEELDRLMPVIYALRDCGKALSVDTYKPEVMQEALIVGADMINDIAGFRSEESKKAVMGKNCGLCVMHMRGDPQTMQIDPEYSNVTEDVIEFLQQHVNDLLERGIERERICIDPGFGFGKTLDHNLTLLKNIGEIQRRLDLPLLAGLSRKTVVATITNRPRDQRLAGSLAAALVAIEKGAHIVRVHDVGETIDAIKIWLAAR